MTQKFVTCQKLISKGRFKWSTLIPVTKSCRNTHRKLERTTLQVKIVSIGQFLSTRTTKMWRIFEKRVFEVGPISNVKVPRDSYFRLPPIFMGGACYVIRYLRKNYLQCNTVHCSHFYKYSALLTGSLRSDIPYYMSGSA